MELHGSFNRFQVGATKAGLKNLFPTAGRPNKLLLLEFHGESKVLVQSLCYSMPRNFEARFSKDFVQVNLLVFRLDAMNFSSEILCSQYIFFWKFINNYFNLFYQWHSLHNSIR